MTYVNNLQGEAICGYEVSAEMKRVWEAELDILARIKEICARHDLKWYAGGGTLLGAVRHGGFIPWDDDIDIDMPREDYEKFLKCAAVELEPPYFLQSHQTERSFPFDMAKVRNSNTTGFIENEKLNGWNLGIFVDIFPVDKEPDDKALKNSGRNEIRKLIRLLDITTRQTVVVCDNSLKHMLKASIKKAARCLTPSFVKENLFSRLVSVSSRYNETATQWCGERTFNQGDCFRWRCDDCAELVELPFEGTTVFAPAGYVRVLDDIYGNWHQYVHDGSCHGGAIFNPDMPFSDYLDLTKSR